MQVLEELTQSEGTVAYPIGSEFERNLACATAIKEIFEQLATSSVLTCTAAELRPPSIFTTASRAVLKTFIPAMSTFDSMDFHIPVAPYPNCAPVMERR